MASITDLADSEKGKITEEIQNILLCPTLDAECKTNLLKLLSFFTVPNKSLDASIQLNDSKEKLKQKTLDKWIRGASHSEQFLCPQNARMSSEITETNNSALSIEHSSEVDQSRRENLPSTANCSSECILDVPNTQNFDDDRSVADNSISPIKRCSPRIRSYPRKAQNLLHSPEINSNPWKANKAKKLSDNKKALKSILNDIRQQDKETTIFQTIQKTETPSESLGQNAINLPEMSNVQIIKEEKCKTEFMEKLITAPPNPNASTNDHIIDYKTSCSPIITNYCLGNKAKLLHSSNNFSYLCDPTLPDNKEDLKSYIKYFEQRHLDEGISNLNTDSQASIKTETLSKPVVTSSSKISTGKKRKKNECKAKFMSGSAVTSPKQNPLTDELITVHETENISNDGDQSQIHSDCLMIDDQTKKSLPEKIAVRKSSRLLLSKIVQDETKQVQSSLINNTLITNANSIEGAMQNNSSTVSSKTALTHRQAQEMESTSKSPRSGHKLMELAEDNKKAPSCDLVSTAFTPISTMPKSDFDQSEESVLKAMPSSLTRPSTNKRAWERNSMAKSPRRVSKEMEVVEPNLEMMPSNLQSTSMIPYTKKLDSNHIEELEQNSQPFLSRSSTNKKKAKYRKSILKSFRGRPKKKVANETNRDAMPSNLQSTTTTMPILNIPNLNSNFHEECNIFLPSKESFDNKTTQQKSITQARRGRPKKIKITEPNRETEPSLYSENLNVILNDCNISTALNDICPQVSHPSTVIDEYPITGLKNTQSNSCTDNMVPFLSNEHDVPKSTLPCSTLPLKAFKCHTDAYSELSNACNMMGIHLDDVLKSPEVKNIMANLSSYPDPIFLFGTRKCKTTGKPIPIMSMHPNKKEFLEKLKTIKVHH